jgi:hypothetical protein
MTAQGTKRGPVWPRPDESATAARPLHAEPAGDGLYPQEALSAPLPTAPTEPTPVDTPAVGAPQEPSDSNTGEAPSRGKALPPSVLAARAKKAEAAERGKMAFRIMRASARRAVAEDPGEGLRMLLEVQGLLKELVDDVGVDLVRSYGDEGAALVAEDLTLSTGEPWSPWRVGKRWGYTSPAARKRSLGGYAPEAIEEED